MAADASEKRDRHDDQCYCNQRPDNLRAFHEGVIGVEMRVCLLVEVAGIHDPAPPQII